MNTKQKLTIGIAAIFMVTLTIVGVTYAYFVTRVGVTGDVAEANVTAVKLGDVSYVAGNEVTTGTDYISMNNILPGNVIYKTFSVKNEGAADSDAANYYVTLLSSVTSPKSLEEGGDVIEFGEFIHTKDGLNTGIEDDCYGVMATNVDNGTKTVVEPKMSTEDEAPAVCFDKTDDISYYNNINVTLYEVTKAEYDKYATDFTATSAEDATTPVTGTVRTVKNVGDNYKLVYSKANEAQTVSEKLSIAGATETYFVLKVEYADAGMNQNAENLAGVDIVVSIRA